MRQRFATTFVVNAYGALLIALGAALTVATLRMPSFGVGATCGSFALASLWSGIRVSWRARSKARIAEALVRKIRSRGYDEAYFAGMCATPCMRLVVRLVLARVGRSHDYRAVVRRHRDGPFTIDVGEGKLREILETGELEMADVERAVREAIGTSLPSRSTPMHLGPSPLAERKLGKPQPSSSISHS